MNARRVALVVSAAAILAVLAFVLGPERTRVAKPGAPGRAEPAEVRTADSARIEGAAAPAASTAPKASGGKGSGASASEPAAGDERRAGPRLRPGDDYPGKGEPFLDEEQLDALLASNSVEELYAALEPEHRRDLVGLLADRGLLRDELAALLELEQDSDARANMIASAVPKGALPEGDDDTLDPEETEPDTDLADLLDDFPTDMDDLELRTRLDAAILADEVAALPMVREVLANAGDDASLLLRAQELLLKLSAGDAPVTPEEASGAQEHLYSALSAPGALAAYEPEERIRGYMALAAAADRERTVRFYEEAMVRETDPRARTVLQGLLRTW